MVWASSLQTLFPSQNGSQTGVPIPPEEIPPIHLQPLSFMTALCPPAGLGGADQSPRSSSHWTVSQPGPPRAFCGPGASCSAVLQSGTGWRCRDGASATYHNVAVGNRLRDWGPSPKSVLAPCSCRPHASSITPSQAAPPHYFTPSCPRNFIILPCLSQPEREKATYLQPRLLGALGPSRLGAARPMWLLWLVFNLQESHWAEMGSSAAGTHPNLPLHRCCWCLRKGGTRDKEHEGFGVWQEPGGRFPRLIFNTWCRIWHTEPVGARPSPQSWDRLPGTSGLRGFFSGRAHPLSVENNAVAPLEGPQAASHGVEGAVRG